MFRILIPNRLLNADDGGGGGGDPTPPAAPPSPAPAPATAPVPAPASLPTPSPIVPPADATDLQARLATLETQLEADRAALRSERGARLIEQTAAAHGLDADLLGRLVKVEFDEHGQPKSLDAAIASLLTTYPYLAKPTTGGTAAPAPIGTSPANPARPPALTKAAIERMTPEQINTNWDAIQAFLARQG